MLRRVKARSLVVFVALEWACSSAPDCPPTPSTPQASTPGMSASPATSIPQAKTGRRDRARSGEIDALKELELVPVADRTPEDCAAIAIGHTELTRSAV